MKFAIFIENTNEFNQIFAPVATRLHLTLKTMGCDSSLQPSSPYFDGRKIVFGAHSDPQYWERYVTDRDILFNYEPVFLRSWRDKNKRYCNLLKKSHVVDYTIKNSPFLAKHYISAVPPAFSCERWPSKTKDALFIGNLSNHRIGQLKKLSEVGIKVHVGFKIFNEKLRTEISKARVFLNINAPQDTNFNIFRFSLCSGMNTLFFGDSGEWTQYSELNPLINHTIIEEKEKLNSALLSILNDKGKYDFLLCEQNSISKQHLLNFESVVKEIANF